MPVEAEKQEKNEIARKQKQMKDNDAESEVEKETLTGKTTFYSICR